MNLFSLLDQAATRFPDRGAVFRGAEPVHSFAELRSRALVQILEDSVATTVFVSPKLAGGA